MSGKFCRYSHLTMKDEKNPFSMNGCWCVHRMEGLLKKVLYLFPAVHWWLRSLEFSQWEQASLCEGLEMVLEGKARKGRDLASPQQMPASFSGETFQCPLCANMLAKCNRGRLLYVGGQGWGSWFRRARIRVTEQSQVSSLRSHGSTNSRNPKGGPHGGFFLTFKVC